MAQNYSLPKPTEPLLDQFGKVSVPWYNYLRTRFGDGAAEEIIASIEAQIADLIARVEALEEGDSAVISGPESVRVVGTLAGGLVQLTLEGDDRGPPPTHYYGTNAVEVKGFHPIADALIQGDGVALTVNVDGTIDIAHADTSSVADISANFTGGTVPDEISFTFDQFGHVLTRTITGRTLDHNDTGALQGGSATERYHFTATEHAGLLPWAGESPTDYALLTQTITNGDTTHAPSGDVVFDALAGKEPAIAPGTDGQFFAGDKMFRNSVTGALGAGGSFAGDPALVGSTFGALWAQSEVADTCRFVNVRCANAGSGGQFIGARSGGSFASKTATPSTVTLFELYGSSYTGSGWVYPASLVYLTQETHSPTARGTRAEISITTSGTTALLLSQRWTHDRHWHPGADNVSNIGSGALRMATLFAGTGAINTSDAREKTIRGPLTEPELAAAAELASIGVIYQWNDAIELKSDDARWHFGPTVQAVIEVMERHGLDPFRYAFVCYDEWAEQPEVRGEAGNVVQEHRPAGDRYSLRPDQLLMFIAAGAAHERAALREQLARLETLLNP